MDNIFLSIGTILIDDIILPNGKSKMGTLGGGVLHSAMGMRIWSEKVGIVSKLGLDLRGPELSRLEDLFDMSGCVYDDSHPSPHFWQIFEFDGTRQGVARDPSLELKKLVPKPDFLLGSRKRILGAHLHCSPDDVVDWVTLLRNIGCQNILWEPWDDYCQRDNLYDFKMKSQLVDIVSPNIQEARKLTGKINLDDILEDLLSSGIPIVALRMASEGSVVVSSDDNRFHIPAYPTENLVDLTGAGNAYCGGFVVGLSQTKNIEKAGWYGAISASMALQQFGALYEIEGTEKIINKRFSWYKSQGYCECL